MLPPLVTVSIIKSISFSVYEETKSRCKKKYPSFFNQESLLSTMTISTLGGFTSGAFIAALSCPFEVIKIQKQLEFLLQASSITTGATIVRSNIISSSDSNNGNFGRSTISRTVGAGLPVSSTTSSPNKIKRSSPPLSSTTTNTNPNNTTFIRESVCMNHQQQQQYNHGRRSTTTTHPSSSSSSSQYSSTNTNSHFQQRKVSTSSWASAKEIVTKKGALALYSGFGLHFLRDSVGTGVYFGTYETTKFLLTKKDQSAGPLTQFLAGGICGILCWLVVFPIDLVKTLKQKEILSPQPLYNSARDCIRDIIKKKGYKGFYSGVSVTLLRAFPIHSLNFLVYEQTLLLVARLSHHQNEHVSL
ncbi:unnamed protein product [Cunninghamella blakesleeana]